MASCVRNIPTKNFQNLIIGFQVTVKNVGNVFETQSSSSIRLISCIWCSGPLSARVRCRQWVWLSKYNLRNTPRIRASIIFRRWLKLWFYHLKLKKYYFS